MMFGPDDEAADAGAPCPSGQQLLQQGIVQFSRFADCDAIHRQQACL